MEAAAKAGEGSGAAGLAARVGADWGAKDWVAVGKVAAGEVGAG